MPICKLCGQMSASADMRRSPKGGWLCRDKPRCKERVRTKKRLDKQATQDVRSGRKGAHAQ